jgi:hypothetical protein
MSTERRSKRRIEREETSIPGKADFFSAGAHTSEDVLIINVTLQGAGILLSSPLRIGQMIKVQFAMPIELRCYDANARFYEIWGVVRFVSEVPPPVVSEETPGESTAYRYEIGVAFSGKQPPSQYLTDPETIFDIKPVRRRDGLWSVRIAPRFSDW